LTADLGQSSLMRRRPPPSSRRHSRLFAERPRNLSIVPGRARSRARVRRYRPRRLGRCHPKADRHGRLSRNTPSWFGPVRDPAPVLSFRRRIILSRREAHPASTATKA
jgi:hypothetical protein